MKEDPVNVGQWRGQTTILVEAETKASTYKQASGIPESRWKMKHVQQMSAGECPKHIFVKWSIASCGFRS